MGPRTRCFVAAVGAIAFLAFYVWAVVAIGDRLPASMWIDLVFYGIAGIVWGIPLIPLLSWAERERKQAPGDGSRVGGSRAPKGH